MKSRVSRLLRRRPGPSLWDSREPVREELFSVERLEEHARSLAVAQTVTAKPDKGHPLAARLADNEAVLLSAHRLVAKAIGSGQPITPAAEWLIDNFHIVEKQIRQVRSDLPSGYYRQLPKLVDGPFAGCPRVFGVAWAFVAHTDSRFDIEVLQRFVRAYQDVQPLTIGELWAVAITLRIVLIENLRRLAEGIVLGRTARDEADRAADRLLGDGERKAEPVGLVLAAYDFEPLPRAFAVQLLHRLRDQDAAISPALDWLDRRLAAQDTTPEAIVGFEHQRQGASSVTIRNIITSMRLISDVDWTELFERMSLVDEVFGESDCGFRDMDFPTRDLYRKATEELARGARLTEVNLARSAVAKAKGEASEKQSQMDGRHGDPGYYLIGGGRRRFEAEIGFSPPFGTWSGRFKRAFGLTGYTSVIAILAVLILALPLNYLSGDGLDWAWLALFGTAGAILAIDAAVALTNHYLLRNLGARPLPALELREGVPPHLRTLVVVPTLLTTPESIEEQIERLEIHHVTSLDGDLHFALLSDWVDAATETRKEDAALLAAAAEGIERLNRRHGPAPGGTRFLLLHRHRVWSESEQRWMGWERKRGKLQELNRLLRGALHTTFIHAGRGPQLLPANVRYVLTLDADTRLPRDTVRRLIGKMAHPLNRPRFDSAARRVVEGYAVLQPRVTPSLPVGREGSLFQRIFSSMNGIDPYAAAASDVYQDLFGEGSYTGKGIYDVDAFETAVAGRVPDSTLLSHDLFEGVYARAGLASDIEVVEAFPARYDAAALRHHRWARGDWQLLPWICGFAPGPGVPRVLRTLPAVGRWKMLDNLRRTLSAPAAVLVLLAAWTLPLHAALIWTFYVVATITLPILIPIVGAIVPRHAAIGMRSHLRSLLADLRLATTLAALQITFLAHQAWLMADAIGRTLVRLFVTRRNLLEWVPAVQATLGPRPDISAFTRWMASAVVIGFLGLAVAWLTGNGTWPLALPFAVLWIVSPAIARWVSLPPPARGHLRVLDEDRHALRLIARRTWRYFERFVTPSDNMLPPDNFQEDPAPSIAHRTSPTNMGLYLLSAASARDFGWAGTIETVERLEATLATMSTMARFRGHFYNWYGTEDLRPLEPHYISSVDSGNLAGHLIALANTAREWRSLPFDPAMRLAGIADALDLTRKEAIRLRDGRRTQTVTFGQLDDSIAGLAESIDQGLAQGEGFAASLSDLSAQAEAMADIASALADERGDGSGDDLQFWAISTQKTIESHRRDLTLSPDVAADLALHLQAIEDATRAMALAMDFGFLFDRDRHLLSIGFVVTEGKLDQNCYDLLASEARLASFVAIAKGDVPARHWFCLGRGVTAIGHGAALISWSGSMFEYLMPSLVMRAPEGSLVEQTARLIVQRQIAYGAKLGVWGISESAYNIRDLELTYQYSNFGVPGLGLKRGLGENAVIAPYATALAAMVDPRAAVSNFEQLTRVGARGRYGFYEALDYTPVRVPAGTPYAMVRAFMAHHQGMSIVAIANTVLDGAMRSRFHAEPMVQATELLLQERTPRDVSLSRPWAAEVKSAVKVGDIEAPGGRRLISAHGPTPETHMYSNGRYTLMLTAAGSGYSRWRDLAVTRWREDATCDDWGSYTYVRDVRSGAIWSAGFQPSATEPDEYEVVFNEDRAAITRRDGSLTTTTEVLVSAEDDAEVRRVSITNAGSWARELDITSYTELVLAPQAADVAHPSFSKLFVETEYLASLGALLATRRRRGPAEPEVWAAHLAVVNAVAVGKSQYETDRARFLGRGSGARRAAAILDGRPLSNTAGIVLDPVFALRRRVRVEPGAIVRIDFWTAVASSRAELLDLIDRHRDTIAFERAATLAWTQAQVQLRHLGIGQGEAALFQRIAGHVLYASSKLRPPSDSIQRGGGGQQGLWSLGISGDLPIVLLRIADAENIDVVRQLLRAHEYWQMKQLAVDLVILNERGPSYVQDLQIALEGLARTSKTRAQTSGEIPRGRVFVVRADLMSAETRTLLASAARAVFVGQRGRLSDQFDRAAGGKEFVRPRIRSTIAVPTLKVAPAMPRLELFNGLGGFADDGREYVTVLGPGQSTPAPWINVIANPGFGFHVATEGGGYTWSVNSRENQITPWSNDPVTDRSGEALYLRDEDSGGVWSPTASPIRDDAATYIAHHGWGYSRFEHTANDIAAELHQYVPIDDPIKISRLRLRNLSTRTRNLSLTAYVEWVLAQSRPASAAFVTTEIDPETGAMLARNPWRVDFGSRVAFADLSGKQTEWTGDRREFLGRNGTPARPAALSSSAPLSKNVGAGLDACAGLRTTFTLPPNGGIELVFFLGEATSTAEARRLVTRYRTADLDAVRAEVDRQWRDVLGAVQVTTPDRSMDIMLNGWLLYQTLACRIWARTAFYQSSGAYGFRDQLQDGMALAATRPALTREHLLRSAARQFVEGDVQHWWRPDTGQGVRTRISDGRVWLAFAVAHYIGVTGDRAILDEMIPFLEGQKLDAGQHDCFLQPTLSEDSGSMFEHCARALDHSLAVGVHGLPLIGTGDWNDGMNRVGEKGKGESVWLAWLLHATLTSFIPFAEAAGNSARAGVWHAHATALEDSLEREAWDGNWYRRGYFDDGTPLGSATSEECRIDSIAQAWAVLSGAGDIERARSAMTSVERELIRTKDRLAVLFAPPFNKTPLDPGYIKGYPPGIRENGGQYTHAALWSVMAFATLGEGEKAARLFALLNPINSARTRADVLRYKVEPYVIAADVYSQPPHVGRGGWTWYTGSAAWMQRAGVESILGIKMEDGFLCLDPCIPKTWPKFEVTLRYRSASYEIVVYNPDGVMHGIVSVKFDGTEITKRERHGRLPLLDDGTRHRIEVRMGSNRVVV